MSKCRLGKLTELVDDIRNSDLLIIGTEGAGARAALEASKYNLRITLITKGRDIAKGGATVIACQSSICIDSKNANELLNLHGDLKDSPNLYFEDIVEEGKYLNDQNLVEVLVEEAPKRVKELVDWGFKFNQLHHLPGHRYPRNCFGDPNTGPKMLRIFKGILRKRGNVEIIGDILALDLLTNNGKITGATAIDLQTGSFIVYKAKSVILATGGYQNIYPHVTCGPDLTGDGLAMAYRAGVELVNMEFSQFLPHALLWPPEWGGAANYAVIIYFLIMNGGHLLNKYGERYLKRWDPKRVEKTTRDIRSIATMVEILDGRGSKHGGVYLSIKHLPDDFIDDLGGKIPTSNWIAAGGIDYRPLIEKMKNGFAIEIAPQAHFTMGGIKINEKCETNIKGLYAAGECASGLNGANRITGVALAQVLVQGTRAGKSAAEYAVKGYQQEINMKQVESSKKRVFQLLERRGGEKAIMVKNKIQKLAYEKVGLVRDATGLREAIKIIRNIEDKDIKNMYVESKDSIFNLEWVVAIETINIAQLLRLITTSALMRNESRGAHYRRDFPHVDNENWLKKIVFRQLGGKMQTFTESPLITRIKPPSGIKPYPGW
ncbi:MAG: FAD-binding protein [Candidatus Hodarchaeota archaeon]